jgi:hypothetical protein
VLALLASYFGGGWIGIALVVVLMGLRIFMRSRRGGFRGRSGQGASGRRSGRSAPEDDSTGRGFFGDPPAS